MTPIGKLATFVAAVALVPAAASAEWLEAKTSHFTIYGNTGQKQMQAFAEQLERFDSALRFVLRLPPPEPDSPNRVTLYMVGTIEEVERRAGRTGVAGFYRATAEGALAVVPQRSDDAVFTTQVLFHEYVHHLTLSNSANPYPSWAAEGLAEFFGTSTINNKGAVTIGVPNNARAYSILSDSPMAASTLLADEPLKGEELQDQKYARAWLLTHYLLVGGKRTNQFAAYLGLLNSGISQPEAASKAFGDIGALNRELNSYRFGSIGGRIIAPEKLHPEPVTIRQMSPAESAIMPYRLRSATGVDRKQALALVDPARKAASAFPGDAFVWRSLAEIEFDAGNTDAAEAACDKALAIDPTNFGALMYKGRVRVRRAAEAKAPAKWAEARPWFLKANKSNPNAAAPFVSYYDSFVGSGQTPTKNAVDGLLRAAYLVPQDKDILWRAATAEINLGDIPLARQLLRPIAYDPHGGKDNPARKLLDQLATTTDPAAARAALAALGKTPSDDDDDE
ncbi:MAG: DUF1570 domain-containing protein [Sphingomonas sp.]